MGFHSPGAFLAVRRGFNFYKIRRAVRGRHLELNKKLKDNDVLGDWIRLFNADTKDELNKIETQITEVQEAMEMVKTMNLGKNLRWLYEQKLKERRDRWAEDEYVRDEGRAEGEAAGIQALISFSRELDLSYEVTYDQVKKRFHLDDEETERNMKQYW